MLAAERLSYTYLDTGYDDRGIGTLLFVLSYVTNIPITVVWEAIAAYSDGVMGTYSMVLASVIAGIICLAADLMLLQFFRRRHAYRLSKP